MAATVSSLFVDLFPNVLVSSTDAAYNLTVSGAASGSYALKVMTVAAACSCRSCCSTRAGPTACSARASTTPRSRSWPARQSR